MEKLDHVIFVSKSWIPILGLYSPSTGETGEKQPCHKVVKCGFFCVKCKARHSKSKVLCFASCVDEKTNHVLVESSHVCIQCFALGHGSELEGSPCPAAAATAEKPDIPEKEAKVTAKETVQPVMPVVGDSKTKSDDPKGSPERKRMIVDELKMVENEIKRLQLLKTLQVERERLAEMIAMKHKVSILFAQHVFISIYFMKKDMTTQLYQRYLIKQSTSIPTRLQQIKVPK